MCMYIYIYMHIDIHTSGKSVGNKTQIGHEWILLRAGAVA